MQNNQKVSIIVCRLTRKRVEAKDITTLFFSPVGKSRIFPFIAGQFVMIYLNAFGSRGRAYTLTSPSGRSELACTVKRMGQFSSVLCRLPIGSRVTVKGPYGRFFPGDRMKKVAFFAGGIGIAPFYTLLRHQVETADTRDSVLFYSNRTVHDIAFKGALDIVERNHGRCKVVYIVTREKPGSFSCETRRIDRRMITKYAGSLRGRYCFLCGSTEFIAGIRRMLVRHGVPDRRILTETFF